MALRGKVLQETLELIEFRASEVDMFRENPGKAFSDNWRRQDLIDAWKAIQDIKALAHDALAGS